MARIPWFARSSSSPGISCSIEGEHTVVDEAVRTEATLSKLSADDIALGVIRGIDTRKAVIFTDAQDHLLWRMKRFTPPLYGWLMAKAVTANPATDRTMHASVWEPPTGSARSVDVPSI